MVTDAARDESDLYLTFRLEREILALEVSRVREVLDLCPITRVPRTPEFMRGVINLRGSVIPVVDLHLKFGLAPQTMTIESRIVVLELDHEGETVVVGVLTDAVHDVIEIPADQIESSPQIGARWRTEYVTGIGKYREHFILLLDIDRLFAKKDVLVSAEA